MTRARGRIKQETEEKDRCAPLFRDLEGQRQGKDLPGRAHPGQGSKPVDSRSLSLRN